MIVTQDRTLRVTPLANNLILINENLYYYFNFGNWYIYIGIDNDDIFIANSFSKIGYSTLYGTIYASGINLQPVPSRYIVADSVQIPTTGYINTLVSAITATTRSKFKVTWQDSTTGNRGLFGVRSGTTLGANSYNVFLTVSGTGPRWDCVRSSSSFSNWQVGETHEVEITHTQEGYGQVIVDGNIEATGTQEQGTDVLDYIYINSFLTISSGTAITGGTMKWHNCQIWSDGSTLSADFVPVFDIRTNSAGLYDIVRKQFFGNDGTGIINAYDAQGNLIGPSYLALEDNNLLLLEDGSKILLQRGVK